MDHRRLFWTIEVNLLLWIVAAVRSGGDGWIILGLLLAVGLQHWAYYDLVRGRKAEG